MSKHHTQKSVWGFRHFKAFLKGYREWNEKVMVRGFSGGERAMHVYRRQLREPLARAQRVCHLGCGYDKNAVTRNVPSHPQIVGVDMDPRAGPKYHSSFWLADATRLPFADSMFDFVCSEYLMEHIANPAELCRESSRVLAPGGRIVLLTPNLWSYKTLVAAYTPYRFHLRLAKFRYRRPVEEDVFPSLYLANTVRCLVRMLQDAGFSEVNFTLSSNGPTWFCGIPLLFEMGFIYHRIIECISHLAFLRCAIVVTAKKPGPKVLPPETLRARCLRCECNGMSENSTRWICPSCGNSYAIKGNVVNVVRSAQHKKEG